MTDKLAPVMRGRPRGAAGGLAEGRGGPLGPKTTREEQQRAETSALSKT